MAKTTKFDVDSQELQKFIKAREEWLKTNSNLRGFYKEHGYLVDQTTGEELRWKQKGGGRGYELQPSSVRERSNKAREERISGSEASMDVERRKVATEMWDELVGDRGKKITFRGKELSFEQFLDLQVKELRGLTRSKASEMTDKGKSVGHGTPTTDTERYAESYTQQFAEDPSGNFGTKDKIPLDQTERLRAAGMPVGVEEAARMEQGYGLVGDQKSPEEIERILKPGPEVPTYSAKLLNELTDDQKFRLQAAKGDLAKQEAIIMENKPAKPGKTAAALRTARNLAPAMLSIPAGIAVTGMSAKAAVQNPTQENVVNAGFDAANTLADLVGLIPTPMTIGASEAAQRALMLGQLSYNGMREAQRIAAMKNK